MVLCLLQPNGKFVTKNAMACANNRAMVGLDKFNTKNTSLTTEKEVAGHRIRVKKFPVTHVAPSI